MKLNQTCRILSTLMLSTLLALPVQSDTVFSASPSAPDHGVEQYSQFILATILKDMGLNFDPAKKNPPDQAPKEKEKEKEKNSSDFWGNDDDFFNRDSSFASDSYEQVVAGFEKNYQDTVKAWNKEYEETVARWTQAKLVYNAEKENYAKATFDLARFSSQANEKPTLTATGARKFNLDVLEAGAYHVIPFALQTDIRNQQTRGTCAAFAGVRAVETLLNQHDSMRGQALDLSEQHFFWLSRDDCHQAPCRAEQAGDGSHFNRGFGFSMQNDPVTALKLEQYCPYSPYPNPDNLSYSPLSDCNRYAGQFRVDKVHPQLKFEQLVDELASNRPVAAALKLPKSFYNSKGLIRLKDPESQQQGIDGHAAGHAVLFVGFIKLPEAMWSSEGKYCALMANSWGVGYGVGGHACPTQKWIEHYAFRPPSDLSRGDFTAIESVRFLHR